MEGIKKHKVFCRITDGAVKKIRRFRNNTKGVTTVEAVSYTHLTLPTICSV